MTNPRPHFLGRRAFLLLVLAVAWCTASARAGDDDETTLFGATGNAVAYIADDLTIYLWSGKPVAYLDKDDAGGFHVYGFNGKHLGWFVRGVLRDQNGAAAGAVKEVFRSPPTLEPFKSFKEFKPFKSFKEFAPFRPTFSTEWSETPLKLFLLQGVAD